MNTKKNGSAAEDSSIASSLFTADEAHREAPLASVKAENAEMLDEARPSIGSPQGHGFYAEAHHAGTYNVNAVRMGSDDSATRLGSTEYASPDIQLNSGETYNLKFYNSPDGTYSAGTDKIEYGGQTLVGPSDQMDEVKELHGQSIENDGSNYAEHFANMKISDRIDDGHGVTSDPLSYGDSKNGTESIRDGNSPDWANPWGADVLGERSLEAAGLALAVDLLPSIYNGIAAAIRGKKSIAEVSSEWTGHLKERGLKVALPTAGKAAASGALAAIDGMDATGATLIVTLSYEIGKHAIDFTNGKIDKATFQKLAARVITDKGSSILLTAGALALLGPVGYLTPIIVGQLVANAAIKGQIVDTLKGAFEDSENIIRRQIRLLEQSNATLVVASNSINNNSNVIKYTSNQNTLLNAAIANVANSIEMKSRIKNRLLSIKNGDAE